MSHVFTTVVEPAEAPLWATNAAQERLEELAEEEFRTCAKPFVEWLRDSDIDIYHLAPLIAAAACVYSEDGRKNVDDYAQDWLLRYKQYRANDQTELDCLLADVIADAREEA